MPKPFVPRVATAFRTQPPCPPLAEELGFRVKVDDHHPNLSRLGIAEWLVREFELGISVDPKHLRGRLIFPVRSARGTLVGYAGRWATRTVPKNRPTFRFVGPAAAEVYNLHYVLEQRMQFPITIVADPLDVLHLRIFTESVVSFFGEEPSDIQLRRLSYHFPNHQFLVLCDETDSGRKLRGKLVERLSPFSAVKAVEFLTPGRTVQSLTRVEMKEEL